MGVQVNGSQLSWGVIAAAAATILGYGGLQLQVRINSQEIQKLDEAPTQIAVLQTTQDNISDELKKIEAHTSAQTELLNQVVRQLAEINAKSE